MSFNSSSNASLDSWGPSVLNYSRAQPIKFGDQLAAFVVGQHGA